jgi:hypothetical protein
MQFGRLLCDCMAFFLEHTGDGDPSFPKRAKKQLQHHIDSFQEQLHIAYYARFMKS